MEGKGGRWAGDGRRRRKEVEEERRKGTGGEQEERTKPEVRMTFSVDLSYTVKVFQF